MPYFSEPQVFPYQAEACQSPEAEPSYSSMDSPENGQHHQVNATHSRQGNQEYGAKWIQKEMDGLEKAMPIWVPTTISISANNYNPILKYYRDASHMFSGTGSSAATINI
ncbi:hypothetical protein LOZ66_000534 [Ophidiomyces ophidiicola]|nr:hypothetical protein LOZ66_000534 [Ophidiomyces ophidiicola]